MKSTVIKAKEWYNCYYNMRDLKRSLDPWNKKILEWILNKKDSKQDKILEMGCGTAIILRTLTEFGFFSNNLYGVDQSYAVIKKVTGQSSLKNLSATNINYLPFKNNYFSIVILAETIEHLENPNLSLNEAYRVLKKGGYLIVSFPNYVNIPWLLCRICAEKLKKPGWINLQPIDQIYFYPQIKRIIEDIGFKFVKTYGSVYLPPILYNSQYLTPLESLFNRMNLESISFHPVLIFRK